MSSFPFALAPVLDRVIRHRSQPRDHGFRVLRLAVLVFLIPYFLISELRNPDGNTENAFSDFLNQAVAVFLIGSFFTWLFVKAEGVVVPESGSTIFDPEFEQTEGEPVTHVFVSPFDIFLFGQIFAVLTTLLSTLQFMGISAIRGWVMKLRSRG